MSSGQNLGISASSAPTSVEHGFPDYTIFERLHASERSAVYRARRMSDDRLVIIKASAPDLLPEEALVRYEREHELLGSLRSEGIITSYGVVRQADCAAIVLEDIGGISLKDHLQRGRVPMAEAIDIALAIARALRDVHTAGIVHRDVNAYNVIHNPTTRATRLIDFELATRWRMDNHGFIAPGALQGTLAYIAPEQTGRMNRRVDVRADLYSLGVTLYELFSGCLPYRGEDPTAIVHFHLAIEPPSLNQIDSNVPEVVSDIVMRLLAKAPEQRYQTAVALETDLGECARRLLETGAIERFGLSEDDVSDRFELPEKLYGREAQVASLLAAFERSAGGAVETVVASGCAGIGKTSIVRELYAPVTRRRGYFANGKFDLLWRDVSYVALVAALEDLVEQLLTENEASLARWRERILAAIAPNAQAVIDALPTVELVIGAQPPLVPLDAAAAHNRFCLTLQKFIQVFARKDHPLVLFLDDVQWADASSLNLLRMVATSAETESLLLILAYRDNEVSENHPLPAMLEELGRRGGRIVRLAVAPLARAHIVELVADTLHQGPDAIARLADVLAWKTDGNPFFIRQFLQALHADGRIHFDGKARRFTFDLATIENAPITDNVIDLLAHNLERLPHDTQRVLTLAAAIGNRFDIETIAIVADSSAADVHEALQPALGAGLVMPVSELEYVDDGSGRPGLMCRRFAFQHDRIQEAAHARLSPEEEEELHVEIGRLLLARTPRCDLDDRLVDIVNHMNRGLDLLVEEDERARVGELALRAGRRARAAGAYAVAVTSFRCAAQLRGWTEDYAAAFQANVGLAESLHLCLDFPGAVAVIDQATGRAASSHDLAELYALKTNLCLHTGAFREALDCCRQAARLLGFVLPQDPSEIASKTEEVMAFVFARIAKTPIESLIDLPRLHDRDKVALIELFYRSMPAAYQAEPPLSALMAIAGVAVSIEHGNCPASAVSYTTVAMVLRSMGLEDWAARFGKLGFDLNKRLDDRSLRASVGMIYGTFTAPWVEPLAPCIALLREAAKNGLESGDYAHMGYAANLVLQLSIFSGEPLGELSEEAQRTHKLVLELGEATIGAIVATSLRLIRAYRGEPADGSDGPPGVTTVTAAQIDTLRLEQRFMFGDVVGALALARATAPMLAATPGMITSAFQRFFHCLAATGTWNETDRPELEATLEANQILMKRWADHCPANFLAMYLTVEGERARLRGNTDEALDYYDRAIAAASKYGLLKLEALANELAARFWIGRHKRELALVYARKARHLYAQWGAHGKVQALEREHPQIAPTVTLARATTSSSLTGNASESLDLAALLKAARAISSEIVLDNLLEVMMEVILENAGAQVGALLLGEHGKLRVRACHGPGAAGIAVVDGIALEDADWIPEGIVNYVARRRESVIADDAGLDPRFATDERVRARRPKSIMCTPIRQKGHLTGVLYLENNLVTGAFTHGRLEALNILVAQIAVSIDNATLFAKQKEHAEELANYRDHLAELVADRIKELSDANQLLREESLARERMEIELRLAQRLQTVGQLAAGVAHEINTPMQYVGTNLEFVNKAFGDVMALVDDCRKNASPDEAPNPKREKRIGFLKKQVPQALDQALDGVKRVTEIVTAMRAFSHPGQKEKMLTDVNDSIQTTLIVGKNEYKYVADLETDLGEVPLVMSFVGEINQLLLNLVVNAAHAIQDVVGTSGERGTIRVATRHEGSSVVISVSDTGCGIPEAIRDRIFDPFFTTKQVGRGTGQGLAIARSVVDRHGGSLTFETETGKGTTFFVKLPLDGRSAAEMNTTQLYG